MEVLLTGDVCDDPSQEKMTAILYSTRAVRGKATANHIVTQGGASKDIAQGSGTNSVWRNEEKNAHD